MNEKKDRSITEWGTEGKKGGENEIPGLEREPRTIAEKMKERKDEKKDKIYT